MDLCDSLLRAERVRVTLAGPGSEHPQGLHVWVRELSAGEVVDLMASPQQEHGFRMLELSVVDESGAAVFVAGAARRLPARVFRHLLAEVNKINGLDVEEAEGN